MKPISLYAQHLYMYEFVFENYKGMNHIIVILINIINHDLQVCTWLDCLVTVSSGRPSKWSHESISVFDKTLQCELLMQRCDNGSWNRTLSCDRPVSGIKTDSVNSNPRCRK
jgi:hypothetical protein